MRRILSLTYFQQLVRFVIEQYRDELIMSLQGNLNDMQIAEDREAIASDLLNILHRFVTCIFVTPIC